MSHSIICYMNFIRPQHATAVILAEVEESHQVRRNCGMLKITGNCLSFMTECLQNTMGAVYRSPWSLYICIHTRDATVPLIFSYRDCGFSVLRMRWAAPGPTHTQICRASISQAGEKVSFISDTGISLELTSRMETSLWEGKRTHAKPWQRRGITTWLWKSRESQSYF